MKRDGLPGLERRAIEQTLSAAAVETRADGSAHLSGYAAVFYDPADPGTEFEPFDDYRERILPGAFDRALREDDVRALFNHDPNVLLGRSKAGTLALAVDRKGLRYDITLPDTQAARDVAESVRRGDLSGSSFAFITTHRQWREENELTIREITGVQLFDVGPVVFPAYQATTTDVAQRSLQEWRAEQAGNAGRPKARLRAAERRYRWQGLAHT